MSESIGFSRDFGPSFSSFDNFGRYPPPPFDDFARYRQDRTSWIDSFSRLPPRRMDLSRGLGSSEKTNSVFSRSVFSRFGDPTALRDYFSELKDSRKAYFIDTVRERKKMPRPTFSREVFSRLSTPIKEEATKKFKTDLVQKINLEQFKELSKLKLHFQGDQLRRLSQAAESSFSTVRQRMVDTYLQETQFQDRLEKETYRELKEKSTWIKENPELLSMGWKAGVESLSGILARELSHQRTHDCRKEKKGAGHKVTKKDLENLYHLHYADFFKQINALGKEHGWSEIVSRQANRDKVIDAARKKKEEIQTNTPLLERHSMSLAESVALKISSQIGDRVWNDPRLKQVYDTFHGEKFDKIKEEVPTQVAEKVFPLISEACRTYLPKVAGSQVEQFIAKEVALLNSRRSIFQGIAIQDNEIMQLQESYNREVRELAIEQTKRAVQQRVAGVPSKKRGQYQAWLEQTHFPKIYEWANKQKSPLGAALPFNFQSYTNSLYLNQQVRDLYFHPHTSPGLSFNRFEWLPTDQKLRILNEVSPLSEKEKSIVEKIISNCNFPQTPQTPQMLDKQSQALQEHHYTHGEEVLFGLHKACGKKMPSPIGERHRQISPDQLILGLKERYEETNQVFSKTFDALRNQPGGG